MTNQEAINRTQEATAVGRCAVCGEKIYRGDLVHYTDLGPVHDGNCFAIWAAAYCASMYPAEPAKEE